MTYEQFSQSLNESISSKLDKVKNNIETAKNEDKPRKIGRHVGNALAALSKININKLSDEEKTEYSSLFKDLNNIINQYKNDIFSDKFPKRQRRFNKIEQNVNNFKDKEEPKEEVKEETKEETKEENTQKVNPKKQHMYDTIANELRKVLPNYDEIIKVGNLPLIKRHGNNKQIQNEIKIIQTILKMTNPPKEPKANEEYYNSGIDGLYGPGTEKAVKLFQKLHGLNPDGIIGTDTWNALLKAVGKNEPVKAIKPDEYVATVQKDIPKETTEETKKEVEEKQEEIKDKLKEQGVDVEETPDENTENKQNKPQSKKVIEELKNANFVDGKSNESQKVYNIINSAIKNGFISAKNAKEFFDAYEEETDETIDDFFYNIEDIFGITDEIKKGIPTNIKKFKQGTKEYLGLNLINSFYNMSKQSPVLRDVIEHSYPSYLAYEQKNREQGNKNQDQQGQQKPINKPQLTPQQLAQAAAANPGNKKLNKQADDAEWAALQKQHAQKKK